MGNIAGSHPNYGAGSFLPIYEVRLHQQSAFDKARGKDALALVYDRAVGKPVKKWLTQEEAIAMCKLLNESEKL